MSVARYQRQPSTLAKHHPRQVPAASVSTRSKGTAAKLPIAKHSQTSQLSSTEIDHRNYCRVLADQGPETSNSRGATADKLLSTNIWKSKERFRKSTPNHRSQSDLNQCHNIQQHHPQTWKQVVELVQDTTTQWAITLD